MRLQGHLPGPDAAGAAALLPAPPPAHRCDARGHAAVRHPVEAQGRPPGPGGVRPQGRRRRPGLHSGGRGWCGRADCALGGLVCSWSGQVQPHARRVRGPPAERRRQHQDVCRLPPVGGELRWRPGVRQEHLEEDQVPAEARLPLHGVLRAATPLQRPRLLRGGPHAGAQAGGEDLRQHPPGGRAAGGVLAEGRAHVGPVQIREDRG
mmetsp:Transcript_5338/g.16656  ORF Transcript_5338/g.16656 Transcript_5338/m.16656 type:complete len:207 (-) Transcript_5338:30-650(-)